MLDFALRLAKDAGKYLKDNIGTDLRMELKGRTNPVTRVDKGSQDIIIGAIDRAFPDHSIIAEEDLNKITGSDYTWYIDPLDGTVNYIHGIPIFCVSIALFQGKVPLMGLCYNPVSEDLFYSEQGKGAFRNGERISVSCTSNLIDSLVVTGFPYSSLKIDHSLDLFKKIIGEVQGVRRLGSAALDLCFVAAGIFDGFWEIGLSPWDVAAGVAIVLEAGGLVTMVDGNPFDIDCGDIIACNPHLFEPLIRILST